MARQQAEFNGDQESEEGELVLQGLCSCSSWPKAPVSLGPSAPASQLGGSICVPPLPSSCSALLSLTTNSRRPTANPPLSPSLHFQINASHLARAHSQKVQQAQMALMHKCNLAKECQRQPRKGSKELQCPYRKPVIGKVKAAAVRAHYLLPDQQWILLSK